MYGLTREQAYPGCPLRELLEFRKANGTFFQDIDEYVAAAKRRVIEGKVFNNVVEVRGRTISISNRPIARRRLGLDPRGHHRAAPPRPGARPDGRAGAAPRRRRGGDRRVPPAHRDHAEDGRRAARWRCARPRPTLFAASSKTSQRAEGAVDTSNEASMNVEIAAGAAEELSASIAEISRQLSQTNTVVSTAVTEAGVDQRADRLARAVGAEDRRRGQADPGRRRADQPARAQRHHRGRPRRRGRPRLRGGGVGGEVAGGADRQGDRGDRRRRSPRCRSRPAPRSRRSGASPSA